ETSADDSGGSTEVDGTAADTTDQPVATDPVEPGASGTEVPGTEAPGTETTGDTVAPPESEPSDTDAAPPGGDDTPEAASAAAVTLVEWAIEAPTDYAAGEITFSATNGGSFPHEFVVIAGEGYESLPLAEGGSVIEDELPTGALIGRTGRLGGGSSEDLTVTLAPGNYVLLCNLGGGGSSHAGQGQRLDITVS
ncbi:MAG: hypothetical protein ABJ382_00960, partial [Ilumatobacter sp.]